MGSTQLLQELVENLRDLLKHTLKRDLKKLGERKKPEENLEDG